MSEIEVERQMEQLHEEIAKVAEEMEAVEELKEEIHHQQEEQSLERKWVNQVALSTGILAAFAAIGALQGNFMGHEAMIYQVKAADQWSYFQAKSTKRHIQESSATILQSLERPVPQTVNDEIARLEEEKKGIEVKARALEKESKQYAEVHQTFAYSVAAIQVAISLGAVATLVRKKPLWYVSLGLAGVGVAFMVSGFLSKPHHAAEHSTPAAEEQH